MLSIIDKKKICNNIIDLLKEIYDPEIPVNIYELGLIYNVDIDDTSNVIITMTLTSPNCPVAESLPEEIKEKISKLNNINNVEINITFEPSWNPEMMSEEARLELGIN